MLVIDNDVGDGAFSLAIGIYLRELYALLLDVDILRLAKEEVSIFALWKTNVSDS